jgi:hypothetical protein
MNKTPIATTDNDLDATITGYYADCAAHEAKMSEVKAEHMRVVLRDGWAAHIAFGKGLGQAYAPPHGGMTE